MATTATETAPVKTSTAEWTRPHRTLGVTHLVVTKERQRIAKRQYTIEPDYSKPGITKAGWFKTDTFSGGEERFFREGDSVNDAKVWLEEIARKHNDIN